MLKVVNLGCERDDRVLFANVSFTLSPGDTLQVQGGNGVGKTTLLRSLAGLSHQYQGDIFWGNRLLKKNHVDFCLSSYFLSHRFGLKLELTPVENLLWSHQLSGRASATDALAALTQVNLRGYEDIPCHQLSAGQCRRVALAGLLMSNAALWVLDEPFTAIDAEGVQWLEGLIDAHARRQGMTLITSHQPLSERIARVRMLKLENYLHSDCREEWEEVDYDCL